MSNVLLHIGRTDESSKWNEFKNNADERTRDTPPIPPRIINLSGLLDNPRSPGGGGSLFAAILL
jgi:hypothetical protein